LQKESGKQIKERETMSKIDINRFNVLSRSSALQAGRMDDFVITSKGVNMGVDFSGMSQMDKVSLFQEILNETKSKLVKDWLLFSHTPTG
jgi:hypothetical protein